MLKKIISIKNIGKFVNYNAAGDVECRPLTLIYSGNGMGKSTLCDIVRSLTTNEPSIILGRKTLGATEDPNVNLMFENIRCDYTKNAWSAPKPNIAIYDSLFVHENIYAGNLVDHDHKKNLYKGFFWLSYG